ncbi:uncharacterized protein PAC_05889 [Phialocephala subalpina]|uniref:Uncharacterized protein n=1 Tax=Phialocephala subalpina TaxID=576137 RepID=A0A1L7WTB7_9HELO|nr:uncharacterized protein PAC_05889 [Phialocephala subalpina]
MNQMHWYIRADEDLRDEAIINLDWSKKIRTPLHGNRFTINLWRCDRANPPSRKENDVVLEGIINCTINPPFEQPPQYINPQGELWRNLDFQVEMKLEGTMLAFVALYNDERQRPLQVYPPFVRSVSSTVSGYLVDSSLDYRFHARQVSPPVATTPDRARALA